MKIDEKLFLSNGMTSPGMAEDRSLNAVSILTFDCQVIQGMEGFIL